MTRRLTRNIAILSLGALVFASVAFLALDGARRDSTSATLKVPGAIGLDTAAHPGVPASPERTAGGPTGEPESNAGSALDESGDQGRLASALRNADRLAAEAAMLAGDALSVDAVESIITTDRFGETLGLLEAQMLRDSLAQELTEAYRLALQAELSAGSSTMELDRLACGMRVCMARVLDHAEVSDWIRWMESLSNNTNVPLHASLDYTIDHGGAGFEHRLVFSTDPSSSELRLKQSPQP